MQCIIISLLAPTSIRCATLAQMEKIKKNGTMSSENSLIYRCMSNFKTPYGLTCTVLKEKRNDIIFIILFHYSQGENI